jgi:pyruvate kinase
VVARLRRQAAAFAATHSGAIDALRDARRTAEAAATSAANLLHYLAIRSEDLRPLHGPLAALGLSSLGRIEPHVLANLDAVLARLRTLCELDERTPEPPAPIGLATAQALLESRADALFGPERRRNDRAAGADQERCAGPSGRIMVTLPSNAASDPALVERLVGAGMTCARINTAHDDREAWVRMAQSVRACAPSCRIVFDLAGPKLRTGPLAPGPRVVVVKPGRDALGRVVDHGVLVLRPRSTVGGDPLPSGTQRRGEIAVDDRWLGTLAPGDGIELRDARGRRRLLHVAERLDDGTVVATTDRTIYLVPGTELRRVGFAAQPATTTVGPLPATVAPIEVRCGDQLVLSFVDACGRPAAEGRPAVVVCALPRALARAKVGDRLWFDDGAIGTVVEDVRPDGLDLRVDHASQRGSKLVEDKGINAPDMDLDVRGLTDDDRAALAIALDHADVVGMSFVRDASDVEELLAALDAGGGSHLGVLLKIETRQAFEHLPSILLAALAAPRAGIMIARGDLAVEIGYERLAEVQEEILWLCEAAHLPVVWATQVLETMAKTGRPSRAEITDAAMAERAECTMLNKGPYIVDAVEFLDRVLGRMRDHQSKKRTILRPLGVARRFGMGQGRDGTAG